MPWTIPDHQASAEEAIARGVISGRLDHLADVPEPLQGTQHQARVSALSILNELGGFSAVVQTPWFPGLWSPIEPPVEPPVTPPSEGWPDPFMSYPLSGPIHLSGESNVTISNLSFEDIRRPYKPILLENCDNITIERIDTRGCTMGLVFALNCTNITIRYCRAENIGYEFFGQTLNEGWINENDCNFYQFDKVDGFECHDLKGRYGNTEDVFSHYMSKNGVVERLHFEGAIADDQPTTDGRPSTMWTSDSGTGIILGDEGGENVRVSDCTMVNAGQVLFQGMGRNQGFDNCIGYGEGGTSQPWNVGTSTWGSNCGGLYVTNTRIWYADNHAWWGCMVPDTTGSVFGDSTLDVEDLRVVL